jgi:hypothetical protein
LQRTRVVVSLTLAGNPSPLNLAFDTDDENKVCPISKKIKKKVKKRFY